MYKSLTSFFLILILLGTGSCADKMSSHFRKQKNITRFNFWVNNNSTTRVEVVQKYNKHNRKGRRTYMAQK